MMFLPLSVAVFAVATMSPSAEAHFHGDGNDRHHMRHRHDEKAVAMAKTQAHLLEQRYLADCALNQFPHGYYGAFLQPCTFTFIQSDPTTLPTVGDACASGKVVGHPVPMHWLFNQTTSSLWDKEDWRDVYDFGSSSSDSFDVDKVDWEAFVKRLMLWPDQCVGSGPRCYSTNDGMDSDESMMIMETLHGLFPDNESAPWTLPATHVQVDCQADAMELSRIVYASADVVDRAVPAIIAVSTAAVILAIVMGMWCCYASVRLYKAWGDRGMTDKIRHVVFTGAANGKAHYGSRFGKYQNKPAVVVVADPADASSVEMPQAKGVDTEYKRLLA